MRVESRRKNRWLPIAERFWMKVDKHHPSGCWLWLSAVGNDGYGLFTLRKGLTRRAHRIAYEWSGGVIPAGAVMRHTCDRILCVNPAHLVPGTQAQNIADRNERGHTARGEGAHKSHWTNADILEMRRRRTEGATLSVIAVAYGTTRTTVSRIVRRKNWTHI